MAIERSTREGSETATSTTPTRRGGQKNEQAVVLVVRPEDVGLKRIKPAGPPTRVGRGF